MILSVKGRVKRMSETIWIYEIVDQVKFDRYFVGKKPNSKKVMLQSIHENRIIANNISYMTMIKHSSYLQKHDIITKRINEKRQKIVNDKKERKKMIRSLKHEIKLIIKNMNMSSLKQVLDFLREIQKKEKKLD